MGRKLKNLSKKDRILISQILWSGKEIISLSLMMLMLKKLAEESMTEIHKLRNWNGSKDSQRTWWKKLVLIRYKFLRNQNKNQNLKIFSRNLNKKNKRKWFNKRRSHNKKLLSKLLLLIEDSSFWVTKVI